MSSAGDRAMEVYEMMTEIEDLKSKLAAAEALLARRPHLSEFYGIVPDHSNGRKEVLEEWCARHGGACAK